MTKSEAKAGVRHRFFSMFRQKGKLHDVDGVASAFRRRLDSMAEEDNLSPDEARTVRSYILYSSASIYALAEANEPELADDLLNTIYSSLIKAIRKNVGSKNRILIRLGDAKVAFESAAADIPDSASQVSKLRKALSLSYGQVANMFGVSDETVRRWEQGKSDPRDRRPALASAMTALDRLNKMFEPGRLADVIRRPAEDFGKKTALDLILGGEIESVADRYEVALRYQG